MTLVVLVCSGAETGWVPFVNREGEVRRHALKAAGVLALTSGIHRFPLFFHEVSDGRTHDTERAR